MKKTILAAALALPLASTAMAAEFKIDGITHEGAVVSYSHQSADNMGFARQRYALGDDWSGTVRVHVEFDGSQWPDREELKPYWNSVVSLASSVNTPFMTLHPLTETLYVYPPCSPHGGLCGGPFPYESQYGADFDSNTLTDVVGSRTFTPDLMSLDFNLTLQDGVDYYLFVNTGGSTDLWPWRPFTIEVTSVPVPASAWLLGSSLLGLAGLRRIKQAA